MFRLAHLKSLHRTVLKTKRPRGQKTVKGEYAGDNRGMGLVKLETKHQIKLGQELAIRNGIGVRNCPNMLQICRRPILFRNS